MEIRSNYRAESKWTIQLGQVRSAVRDTHPGPPMVARMLRVLSNCECDSWVAYDARALGTQLGISLRRPASERTDTNKNQAISYASFRVAVDLFPSEAVMFDSLMSSLGYDLSNATTDTTTSAGIGNVACGAVLKECTGSDDNVVLGDLYGRGR